MGDLVQDGGEVGVVGEREDGCVVEARKVPQWLIRNSIAALVLGTAMNSSGPANDAVFDGVD